MFIKAYGIYHELANSLDQLSDLLESDKKLTVGDYNFKSPSLVDRKFVNREDLSVLNPISIIALNSLYNLINHNPENKLMLLDELSNAMVFTACDGPDVSAEINNSDKLFRSCGEDESKFWESIDQVHKISHPLDVLRLLTTNALYHVSKVINTHNEGYPIQTASLSSLVALDMAHSYLSLDSNSDTGIISSAGDMKNVEYLPYWLKINKVKGINNSDGIIPMWGGASILLSKNKEGAVAEILDIKIFYSPKSLFLDNEWNLIVDSLLNKNITPDVFITYDNGVQEQGASEVKVLEKHFKNARLKNYKEYLGYSGKSNTMLDICCLLQDKDILSGDIVCVNGAGLDYGIGYVVLKKV